MTDRAELCVKFDGIATMTATVVYRGHACSLDQVIDAAKQPDLELSSTYRDILEQIAPQLHLTTRVERDGDADCGCSWLTVDLVYDHNNGQGGHVVSGGRINSFEIRGWKWSGSQSAAAHREVLAKANELGLGHAGYWHKGSRTVREALAAM